MPVWDAFSQDVRYTLRALRRSAAFAVFAILILALGVGATTAVFSIARALIYRPLPFHDPDRLVWIANTGRTSSLSAVTSRTSNLRDWRRMNQSFVDLGGYFAFFDYGGFTLTGAGEPERLAGVGVTETFLDVLGVRPALGRGFVAEECVWNGRPAVILTHGFWQRRFAGDPSIVGRHLTLDGTPTAVVGVLPRSFDFSSIFSPGTAVDLLTPFPVSDETDRWGNTLAIVGRLKPGVAAETALRELEVINAQLRQADPARWGLGAAVTPLRSQLTGRFGTAVIVLACAVGGVLLIACANLSNLLLARAASRRREMAVRSALGASRARLVRQLLTESVILSVCGAAAGVAVAVAITRAVAGTRAISIPLLHTVTVDGAALAFTVLVACVTGLLFGIVPALQLSAGRAHEALHDAERGSSEGRAGAWTRNGLMVAEVALACVLVAGAGLLLRSFLRLLDVELGFRPERAVAWRIETGRSFATPEERLAYHQRLLRAVAAVPGVQSAGATDSLPLGRNRSWGARAKGVVYERGQSPIVFPRMVDSGYLPTMGIAIVAGRGFRDDDSADRQKVLVVNQTMARTLWPGRDPLGQVALVNGEEWQVVGVAADVRHSALEREAESEMYMPITQQRDWGSLDLVVRSQGSPAAVVSGVRAALREADAGLPIGDAQPIGDLVDRAVSPRRFLLQLLGAFAASALALAALGIYAVVSYSVGQRRQELGIRMALGASAGHVLARVLAGTLALTAAGIALGLAGALALSRLIGSLLYAVPPTDPATLAGMALVLTAAALAAASIPALRATRIDIAQVLRS